MKKDWEDLTYKTSSISDKDKAMIAKTAAQAAKFNAEAQAILAKTEIEKADAEHRRKMENLKFDFDCKLKRDQLELEKDKQTHTLEKIRAEIEAEKKKLEMEANKSVIDADLHQRELDIKEFEANQQSKTNTLPVLAAALTGLATIVGAGINAASVAADRKERMKIAEKSYDETRYITDKVLKTAEEDIIPTTSIKAINDLRRK